MYNRPDDTVTVGTGSTGNGITSSTNPHSSVAILENGYTYDMHKLLSSFLSPAFETAERMTKEALKMV